jgi:hypothetical protein
MAMGAGEEPHGKPAAAVSMAEAAQGWVLPTRARHGTDRVRRPADLLFAVFSLLIVAVVLGFIRAVPLGSTEVAGDTSSAHIPCGDVLAAHPGRLDLLPGAAAARRPLAVPGQPQAESARQRPDLPPHAAACGP